MNRRIIRPEGFAKYRKKRSLLKKGYYVVRDPLGRFAKVKQKNAAIIPKGWTVYKNTKMGLYYEGGVLNELTHCLLEITSRKHARWFTSPRNMNIGIIFGRLTDAKT